MVQATRARTAETPKQTSLCLRLRASFFYPTPLSFPLAAMGLVIAYVVRGILEDQRSVLPVSVNLEGDYGQHDVCFSMPCVVGANGVEYRLAPEVNDAARQGLKASAQVLRESLQGMTIESAS